MAYVNPKTGKIYPTMKMAPICTISDYDLGKVAKFPCDTCPAMQIAKSHGYLACQTACEVYDDEVASAFGYVEVRYNPTTERYVPINFMRISER